MRAKRAAARGPADLAHWLTIEQAAQTLNVSTRTIDRYRIRKRIQSQLTKRGGPKIRVYHPGDVEKIRKEEHPEVPPFVLPAETTALVKSAAPPPVGSPTRHAEQNLAGQIARISHLIEVAVQHRPELPITSLVYLKPGQAAQFTGLPKSLIMRLVRTRQVFALKTGAGWKIQRQDLERTARALEQGDVDALTRGRSPEHRIAEKPADRKYSA